VRANDAKQTAKKWVEANVDKSTLALFWKQWSGYQGRLKETLEPLTDEQLTLRAGPGLRSLGEVAAHIVASRAWWLYAFLGEGSRDLEPLIHWDDPDAPPRSATELLTGFDLTWQVIIGCLSRWSDADMQQTFPLDEEDGRHSDLSRSYVAWHMLQHDLLHGGEIAITFGVHGMETSYM
jgi:uncharacterized damage-inducible protein DinB